MTKPSPHGMLLVRLGLLSALLSMVASSHARAESDPPWGVSASAALSRTPKDWAPAMAAAGVTLVRGFSVGGKLAELAPYKDSKLAVSGILMWSPKQPLTLPIADLDGFRRYVTNTITHYRGVVKYWEVWNEPPNGTVDTSPTSYAKVVAIAYDAAKAIDPAVKIGLATKSTHLKYLAEAIQAGARDKFDFISLHPYEQAELIAQGCEQPFLGVVGNVRAMLRELDAARAEVPIWFSEVSLQLSSKGRFAIDEATQADLLVKIYTMALAQGIAHIDWFDARDSEGKQHGLLRGDGQPRPAYYAYKQLRAVLGRNPHFLGYISPTPSSLGFLFEGPTADVMVTWSQLGAQPQLTLPPSAVASHPNSKDTYTARSLELSSVPLLVTAPRGTAASKEWRKRASRLRAPWAVPREATAIKWMPGEASAAFCIVGAPAAAVYGDAKELNLQNTVGAWIAVDPSFMGYAGRPIQLELVVRGHGRGNPGFNLKYESRKPLASANDHGMVLKGTWTSIKGTTPTQLAWKIDDASFIGKYGANLAIECDSKQYCDFSILSLSIRKQ